ncbi:hypothetical protein NJB95_07270 [Brucella intermedia]|uniref:Uncharacterized protein n=1 Tax=Brucella pseudintermedia TaxID=370111 RepID=A0ABY5UG03_9HYPH|nr:MULTISPECIES: hypothetical protein [Brucella]MCO7736411.1 hypothetical protein [Brucella intermedia]UWL62261.1 hypothetical protein NIK97_20645 [Brucella pseudintermedia]WLF99084.1 hypothetical protein Q5698_15320 [Brucella intermedia]
MGKNPYRSGYDSYRNGYWSNPFHSTISRDEWQRGFQDAEAADVQERSEAANRRDELWNVPERAKDAYIAMEDDFSPQTVLDFMLAMYPEAAE